jgi:hypothetical protein
MYYIKWEILPFVNLNNFRRAEMNKILLTSILALGITVVSTSVMAFDTAVTMRQGRGTDNNVLGNIRQCRGCDDPVGHIRQSRGADDVGGARGIHADGHISGRDRVRPVRVLGGSNSGRGQGMGAVGTTNPAGHVRGRGADDVGGARGIHADGHISGRDRVSLGSMAAIGLIGR